MEYISFDRFYFIKLHVELIDRLVFNYVTKVDDLEYSRICLVVYEMVFQISWISIELSKRS